MGKTLPLSEVKSRLPELIAGCRSVRRSDLTKNGRPAAVLINYDEYEWLKETLEVLSDPDLMQQTHPKSYLLSSR